MCANLAWKWNRNSKSHDSAPCIPTWQNALQRDCFFEVVLVLQINIVCLANKIYLHFFRQKTQDKYWRTFIWHCLITTTLLSYKQSITPKAIDFSEKLPTCLGTKRSTFESGGGVGVHLARRPREINNKYSDRVRVKWIKLRVEAEKWKAKHISKKTEIRVFSEFPPIWSKANF